MLMIEIVEGDWVDIDQVRRIRLYPPPGAGRPPKGVQIFFVGVKDPTHFDVQALTAQGRTALEGILPEGV